jgi:hypothetical protein
MVKSLLAKIFLFVGIASILTIWLVGPDTANSLAKEDGVVETLSAIFWLSASVFSLVIAIRVKSKQKVMPIVWALLCFVFLGEETSWFQRTLNYSVPSIEQVSTQNEFNIHNLEILQNRDSDSFVSRLLLPQNIFRIGFFGYFLFLPILLILPKLKVIASDIGFVKLDLEYLVIFIIVFSLSFALMFLPHDDLARRAITETREMLYALFVLIYVIAFMWPSNEKKWL